MATNTLGEFSDGEDDFVFEIDESLWNNDENVWEWSDPEADDLIRNIDENEVLRQLNQPSNTLGEFSDGEEDDII